MFCKKILKYVFAVLSSLLNMAVIKSRNLIVVKVIKCMFVELSQKMEKNIVINTS